MSAGLPYSLASWLISHTKSELLSTGASSTKPTAAQGIFYFLFSFWVFSLWWI
jgi:hypothetical protein